MTMGGASLCDSLVAACMSSASHSSGDRLTQFIWPRRSRLVNNCSLHGSQASSRNNNASSSLFESNNTSFNPKQRRFNRASTSGQVTTLEMEKDAMVNKPRRVVVTGMGVETPLGHDPHTFYDNLLQGKSGISHIESFDCSAFPTRIAGEIKSFSTDGLVAPKLSKRMDKFMLYLLTAGKKALEDGGVTGDVMAEFDKSRCGVLIGSAMGGMKVFYDALEALKISYRKMNPFCVPFATTNMGSAMLALDLV